MADSYIIANSGDGGSGGADAAHSGTFTALTWIGPSSGEYTITILQSTHERGTDPMVEVFEDVGGTFNLVDVSVSVNALGDVTLSVSEIPDTRFPGRVIIV